MHLGLFRWLQNFLSGSPEFLAATLQEYAELRQVHSAKKPKEYWTLQEARERKFMPDFDKHPVPQPNFTGVKYYNDFPLEELKKKEIHRLDLLLPGMGIQGKIPGHSG